MSATYKEEQANGDQGRSERKCNIARVRDLNDALRTTLKGGEFVLTSGVKALPAEIREQALSRMRAYDDFTKANDPFREHAFGAFKLKDQEFFWRIEAFDKQLRYGSQDPSNPDKTTRVLTLMLASEY